MTIYQRFISTAETFPEHQFVADIVDGTFRVKTYQDVRARVERLSGAFSAYGVSAGSHVALMLPNGSDWVVCDLVCAAIGAVVIPIHTTFNEHNIKHILENSDAMFLVVDAALYNAHQGVIEQFKNIKIIISGHHDTLPTLNSMLSTEKKEFRIASDSESLHTIIYTSGTTGMPKGVMLTHHNILSDLDAARKYIDIRSDDRFFSFLPLSHALERTGGLYTPMSAGAAIYYASHPQRLAEEIRIAQPTILIAVPRIFEKVHEKILAKVNRASMRKKLFYSALQVARSHAKGKLSFAESIRYRVLDLLVLKKIRGALGGRLRFAISGGASLDTRIARFFETLGIRIIEGYGLTETSPIVAENKLDRYKFGTVGLPLENVEVKIAENKEILIRGEIVTKGYYKNEEATAELVDEAGWLHTGDTGFIDADGFLTVIGRLKEIIVLSTGKNINPVPIEQALNITKYISQSMVYGDKEKHLSAIIVPDFAELDIWLKQQGVAVSAKESLLDEMVQKLFADEIHTALSGFDKIEQIEHWKLIDAEFTQENGMLTPTLKLRRKVVLESNGAHV